MILIITDQVAGAEYILPVLEKIEEKKEEDFIIYSSETSSLIWKKTKFKFEIITHISKNEANKLISEKKPRLVILSTSSNSFIERAFILAAKENKIPTIQFIDMWVNYKERFQLTDLKAPQCLQAGQIIYPDIILTLDKTAEQDMILEGIPKEIIHIVGQPNFEAKVKLSQPAEDKSEIFLITQPISKFFGKSLGYDQFDFINVCLSALNAAKISLKKVHILVHPAEDLAEYDGLVPEIMKAQVLQNSDINFDKAELIIGMFSSLLVQSILMGVRTISVQPDAQGLDKFHFSRLGFVPRFTDEQNLKLFLEAPKINNVENKFFELFDGSCDRVKRLLLT